MTKAVHGKIATSPYLAALSGITTGELKMLHEINNAYGYLTTHVAFPIIVVLIIFFAIMAILIYFIPTRIAFQRDDRNKWFILFLNILYAWTVVMWFVIFFWALLDEKNDADDHAQKTKIAPY